MIERLPRIAMLLKIVRRIIRESRYVLEEAKETPMGFKFIGNPTMEDGSFEQTEVQIAKKCLELTEVFINIGANIGYYCCIALNCDKATIAFEPIETNLRYLYKNVKVNNWENHIEIFPIALSNKTGLVQMYGGGTGASLIKGWAGTSGEFVSMVPCSTLDDVLSTRLRGKKSFILVDIEGAEYYMLKGATHFLRMQPKPVWMVEIMVTDHQPRGTTINPNLLSSFQLFWDNDYDAWAVDKTPRRVTKEEVESICMGGGNTLPTHNFLFCEKGQENEVLCLDIGVRVANEPHQ